MGAGDVVSFVCRNPDLGVLWVAHRRFSQGEPGRRLAEACNLLIDLERSLKTFLVRLAR